MGNYYIIIGILDYIYTNRETHTILYYNILLHYVLAYIIQSD